MSKYADRLKKDKDSVKAEEISLAEAHAKASVKGKIASLEAQQATLNAAYNSALGSTNFNVEQVFKLTKELATNKEELALAEQILKDEF